MVLFGDKGSAVSKKVATIGAEIDGANRNLAIYQEIIDDEKLPVENIDIKAENITIDANDIVIDGNIMLNTITEEYLDELFPIIHIEDQGE